MTVNAAVSPQTSDSTPAIKDPAAMPNRCGGIDTVMSSGSRTLGDFQENLVLTGGKTSALAFGSPTRGAP